MVRDFLREAEDVIVFRQQVRNRAAERLLGEPFPGYFGLTRWRRLGTRPIMSSTVPSRHIGHFMGRSHTVRRPDRLSDGYVSTWKWIPLRGL